MPDPSSTDVGLSALFERSELPAYDVPDPLRALYGGPIGFDAPVVYANFVSTLDGVVAMGPDVPPSVISGKSAADRFVMGLLRACAGAVVVGAGTLRAEPKHLWTPDRIDPDRAGAHSELRERLGLDLGGPALYLLTESGNVDPELPAFRRGATVITTPRGAARLAGRLPRPSRAVEAGPDTITAAAAMAVVRGDGHRVVLTEGGPTIIGEFLRGGALDELFLTLAPKLVGSTGEIGMLEGAAPAAPLDLELRSALEHESYLFLRYAIGRGLSPREAARAARVQRSG
jgi:riboflavin biosynthesis pyrimidine reductase